MMKGVCKHFDLDWLGTGFTIILGETVEDCYDSYDKEFIDSSHKELEFNKLNVAASIQTVSRSKTSDEKGEKLCNVMLLPKETTDFKKEYIAHEAVHVAYFILGYVGIEVSLHNHEALAVLTQYIYSKVEEEIDNWKD